MENAFVLGAGLGTRLRPLTDDLPKPLVPVGPRPLVTYLFDHLIAAGAEHIFLNTHHLPGTYTAAFPTGTYRNIPLTFRHEESLLDSGGGLANSLDLLRASASPTLVANGDILTDLPLAPARDAHAAAAASGVLATLVLRSTGRKRNVSLDPATGRITDLRGLLKSPVAPGYQFASFYFVEPGFFDVLASHGAPGTKFSIIDTFLQLASEGRLAGTVEDGGTWQDLTDPGSYIDAHAALFPGETNTISGGCHIGKGASLDRCVLWPGSTVAPGVTLSRCVVRSGRVADRDANSHVF